MQNLIVSFNAVAPLFLLIITGFFIRRRGMLRDEALPQMNRLAFAVFLPALLFNNLYSTNVQSAFSPRLLGYAVFSALAMYGLAVLVVCALEKDSKNRGAMIQAIYRSNFVLLGLPIVQTLFEGEDLGVTSVIIAVIVPIFNVLAVVTLEVFRGGRVQWKKVLLGITQNPLIIASVLGFVCMAAGVKLPVFLHTAVKNLASAATPVALVVLGASIHLEKFAGNTRNLAVCVLGRLVIAPLIFVTGGALLGFRGIELATLLVMLAAPTAVSSFTMAQQMDSNGELAAEAVVMTSAFSCVTIFLWVFVFKQLNLI